LIGASKPSQIEELCAGVSAPALAEEEIACIEGILQNKP
jgi:aryl-alcohol dehydrogenase-like predicted oxidoreductase